ncbi:PHB depolymerase family esterase [Pseudoduganella ginsengisoli]|uniref:PHB depolymerase family esterase n=1 Tax=Pseudoduganella ginsengisoli TaxID=1462440 RepID=A0A6L6PZ69_9BURK|nr:PHB depolymerase family esterase [Pseudoduganella ginsengisoli]MTW02913.1 PHB depolymerase family esterase [Pseudoduganella ginsengisoli]
MAKSAPGMRLLRSLTRAAKSQQKMVSRLLAVSKPKAQPKPKRAAVALRSPAALELRKHDRKETPVAPGKWLAAHIALPQLPGQPPGRRMAYWLYLPDQPAPALGWPLIVMLHGCQQSATQFAQGTRMNRVAEQKGYAVLYPQQLASSQAQRCWRWYDSATQQGGGDTELLAMLVAKVCVQHGFNVRRIYACGLSAGAGMAAVLALNHPELIAAVGLHSGPVFGAGHTPAGALHVMRHGAVSHADAIEGVLRGRPGFPGMPALLIQGDADHVVHPVNQQQLTRQWLLLNGLPLSARATVTSRDATRSGSRHAHTIRDYAAGNKVVLRVASIAGLGHAWSGGDPEWKFNAAAGPDASRMMAAFFAQHRRS